VTIINNLFYNNNRGYHIQLADGASNWLVANNTFAFGTGNGEAGQIMFWGNNSGITLRNNIFYNPNVSALTRWSATVTNSPFDHNLIYGVSTIISDSTGFTIGTNQIGPNPSFVNASKAPYDFHTNSGAPGIDAGMNFAQVPIDIDGSARPQGTSTDLGATEFSTATNAPVISGVFTSNIASNSVLIGWTTDVASTSYVEYGPGGYTNTTPMDANLVTLHSVALSGLSPSTLYHFRVDSAAGGSVGVSTDYTFTTSGGVAPATSFSLSPATSSSSVVLGQSTSNTITATLLTGNPGAVTFAATSLPVGVTATFSTTTCTATCSTQLTLSASTAASPGTYSVGLTGTGGGYSASTTVTLVVTTRNKHH